MTVHRAALRAQVWRSSGRVALPVSLVVVVLHVVLRPMPWRFDVGWALLQFGFVTTMLGPLVAAVAAFDGSRFGPAMPVLVSGGRPTAGLARVAAAAWAWAVAAYVVGLTVVVVMCAGAGAGLPSLWTIVAAVTGPWLLLAAASAGGAALGLRLGRWFAAPLAGIGCYVAIVVAFVSQHEVWVRVGGANEEVLGLSVDARYVAWQWSWFVALTITALLVGGRPSPSTPGVRGLTELAAASTVVVALASAALAPPMYRRDARPLECLGARPQICVLASFVRFEPKVRARFAPALALWQRIGGPPPTRISMIVRADQPPGGPVSLPVNVLVDSRSAADPDQLILNAALGRCPAGSQRPGPSAGYSLAVWFHDRLHPDRPPLGTSLDEWLDLPYAEQVRWATDELARVRRVCGA